MRIEFLRGGSGKWVAHAGKVRLGSGHVPRHVTGDEFRVVALRQLRRQLVGGIADPGYDLGGGYLSEAVADFVTEELVTKIRQASLDRL